MTERGGGSCRGQRAPHEVGPGSWETRKAPEKRPVFFSCPFGKRTSHFLLPVKLFRTFLFKRPLNVLLTTTRGVGGGRGMAPPLPLPGPLWLRARSLRSDPLRPPLSLASLSTRAPPGS